MKWASFSPSGGEVEGRACEGVRSLAGVDSGDCGRDCEGHGFFFCCVQRPTPICFLCFPRLLLEQRIRVGSSMVSMHPKGCHVILQLRKAKLFMDIC